MRSGPASLLLHRGAGPAHLDLVLGVGARCPTLGLHPAGAGWTGIWKPAHRRRWLAFSGPVAGGRGAVESRWRGVARWHRSAGGWRIILCGLGLVVTRGKALSLTPGPPNMPGSWSSWIGSPQIVMRRRPP